MTSTKQFRLGYLVHDVSRLRRNVLDKILKPVGITRSQWWVLSNLARNSRHEMRQTELAQLLDVGKVALGGLIDRLEAGGYVTRTADPHDRRAKHITMTQQGEQLLHLMTERARSINAMMNGDLSDEEIEATEDILSRMKQRLIAIENDMRSGTAPPGFFGDTMHDPEEPTD
jgi:MarR family transcriptional regulator for hemolysin